MSDQSLCSAVPRIFFLRENVRLHDVGSITVGDLMFLGMQDFAQILIAQIVPKNVLGGAAASLAPTALVGSFPKCFYCYTFYDLSMAILI